MSYLFNYYPLAFYASVLVLGPCIGSFLNVVAYRIPIMMKRALEADFKDLNSDEPPSTEPPSQPAFNLLTPASRCCECGSGIKPWHNIPVFGWLFLKGKCANCQASISPRYPIVEAITGVLSVAVAIKFGVTWQTAGLLIFTWFLVALTLIDLDEYLLPDSMTLPLVWIGLLCNTYGIFTDLQSAVYGAMIGYLALWSIFWLFKIVTGKEGMGYGDFKLLAAIGAFLGWQALPVVVLLSSVVGAVVGIIGIMVLGRDKNIPIPFGPYLAAAGWLAALWGTELTTAYFQMMGL